MEQPNLLDATASAIERDLGIDRADRGVADRWRTAALMAVRMCCLGMAEFTVDDVWATGLPVPREGRALGAVMRQAAKSGWCTATDRTRRTAQVKSHRAPVTVWRSNILATHAVTVRP